MSPGDPIRVFVTHAWQESDDYLRVFEYLESARNFRYRNVTAPAVQVSGHEAVRTELRRQIDAAEVVVALASLAAQDRDLLYFELNYAKGRDKPVVMLPGFGREIQLPKEFSGLADEQAAWDERSLVDSLRRQARHEETARWDTIEFKLD
jgi:hypothetical protein